MKLKIAISGIVLFALAAFGQNLNPTNIAPGTAQITAANATFASTCENSSNATNLFGGITGVPALAEYNLGSQTALGSALPIYSTAFLLVADYFRTATNSPIGGAFLFATGTIDENGGVAWGNNGFSLTNLNPTSIASGTAAIDISGNAATSTTASMTASNSVMDSGIGTFVTGTNKVFSSKAQSTNSIILSYWAVDGSLAYIGVTNIFNGASFTVKSSNIADTNKFSWAIIKK